MAADDPMKKRNANAMRNVSTLHMSAALGRQCVISARSFLSGKYVLWEGVEYSEGFEAARRVVMLAEML